MRAVLGLVIAAAALVTGWAWSVSSPVGSAPDDDFHMASIWCPEAMSGQCNAQYDAEGYPVVVEIPEAIDAPCYRFAGEESAACVTDDHVRTYTEHRVNSGQYPFGFYRFMHLFVGEDPASSILTMRMANVTLTAGLLGAITALLSAEKRRVALLTVLGGLVPLGWFLLSSVNPSSWAITGVLGTFLALYGGLDSSGWRRIALHSLAVASAGMASAARADAAAFAVIAAGAAVLLQRRAVLRAPLQLMTPGVILVLAVAAFFGAGHIAVLGGGGTTMDLAGTVITSTPAPEHGWAAKLFYNITEFPSLIFGSFGLYWGLGWLDTEMPDATGIGASIVFVALIMTGLRAMNGIKAVVVAGVFGLVVFLPLYMLQSGDYWLGEWVQPRYITPIVVLLLAVALTQGAGDRTNRLTAGQALVIFGLITGAHATALHANIRRYVTGLDVVSADLTERAEWWWEAGPGPNTVWLVGAAAFTVFAALIMVAELTAARNTRAAVTSRCAASRRHVRSNTEPLSAPLPMPGDTVGETSDAAEVGERADPDH